MCTTIQIWVHQARIFVTIESLAVLGFKTVGNQNRKVIIDSMLDW